MNVINPINPINLPSPIINIIWDTQIIMMATDHFVGTIYMQPQHP